MESFPTLMGSVSRSSEGSVSTDLIKGESKSRKNWAFLAPLNYCSEVTSKKSSKSMFLPSILENKSDKIGIGSPELVQFRAFIDFNFDRHLVMKYVSKSSPARNLAAISYLNQIEKHILFPRVLSIPVQRQYHLLQKSRGVLPPCFVHRKHHLCQILWLCLKQIK